MRIFIQVKPNAREEKVLRVDASHYVVSVTEPASEDRANRAVARAIASYLEVGASRVSIVSGRKARRKVIEIS
ncbi:DUF167 domain-containing protein [Patescibacteria group bacterium]|nr:DUF167 domain-containing protein [Patescibacteria group bacterium]